VPQKQTGCSKQQQRLGKVRLVAGCKRHGERKSSPKTKR
jgi:hypothetical protein